MIEQRLRPEGHPVPMWPEKGEGFLREQEYFDFRTERLDGTVDSLSRGGYFSRTVKKDGTLVAWSCSLPPQIEGTTLSVLRERMEVPVANDEGMRKMVHAIRATMPILDIDSKKGMRMYLPKQGKDIPIIRFSQSGVRKLPVSLQDVFPKSLLPFLSGLTLQLRVVLGQNDIEAIKDQFHNRLQGGMLSETIARSFVSPHLELESAMTRKK